VQVLAGHRVQHCDVPGPYKGGLLLPPAVTLREVSALAMLMTWKCAAASPMAVLRRDCLDPTRCVGELERITRRYTSELIKDIGPEVHSCTRHGHFRREMAWMMDTYSVNVGHAKRGL